MLVSKLIKYNVKRLTQHYRAKHLVYSYCIVFSRQRENQIRLFCPFLFFCYLCFICDASSSFKCNYICNFNILMFVLYWLSFKTRNIKVICSIENSSYFFCKFDSLGQNIYKIIKHHIFHLVLQKKRTFQSHWCNPDLLV